MTQPISWLLLFGQLFESVIHPRGFSIRCGGSYLEFLTPVVVMMTALFFSASVGTVYIEDMNRGVMDQRFPYRHAATTPYEPMETTHPHDLVRAPAAWNAERMGDDRFVDILSRQGYAGR